MSSHGDAPVHVPQQGQLPAGQVRFLVGSIAPEIDGRAAAGTPYGRLSPASLQVGTDGSVRIADAPRSVESDAHAAPEVLGGAPPTVRSEVFSLASTTYTLLTGHPPNPYGFATVRRARPDLDPRVDGVLAQATARGPEFRFATATAFAEALGVALGTPVEPIPPTVPASAPAAADRPVIAPAPAQQSGNRFEMSETALAFTLIVLVAIVGMLCLAMFFL